MVTCACSIELCPGRGAGCVPLICVTVSYAVRTFVISSPNTSFPSSMRTSTRPALIRLINSAAV